MEGPEQQENSIADYLKYTKIDEKGQTETDFVAKYDVSDAYLQMIKAKYQKDKDFVTPENDMEREVALDSIIAQLVEVKGGTWGKPVKLLQQAIKFLIDEVIKVFNSEPMLLDLEAPIKIFGDVHGQYFDLFRLFDVAGYPQGN